MTETARFFDNTLYSEGDQAEVQARMWRDGVIVGVGGELAVTSGGAGLASIAAGEAFVQGFWYKNTAARVLAITANLSGTARVDLVVLKLDRVANTLLAFIHEGTIGGGTPAITQVAGGTWELLLATISTASGVSTITDARTYQSNMFNPMTTSQDVIVADSRGVPSRKAKGAIGTYLGVDGTGNIAYSVPPGFSNPMAAQDDIIIGGVAGVATRVAKGSTGQLVGIDPTGHTSFVSSLPVGSVMNYAGAAAPAGWVLCYGQAISRTTYAALFTAIGTAFGVGDGSTTFNLPDCRGRVPIGKDNMGGSSASRMVTNITGGTLGAVGGAESHTLTTAQLAVHSHGFIATVNPAGGGSGYPVEGGSNVTAAGFGTTNAGSGSAHNNTQPGIILNTIIFAGV